jgi:hypothetical protein
MKSMKTHRKEIKIAATVHELLTREAGEYFLSHKEYTEAAIRYFASRKLNPKTIKDGTAYGLHAALDKGFEEVIALLVRQEKEKGEVMLESLRGVLHEQINARVLTEVLLNNLHQLSRLGGEELQQLIEKNRQYIRQRKQDILKVYKQEKQEP